MMSKRSIFILLIIFSFNIVYGKKESLIVGLSSFKDSSWSRINSENDVELLKKTLEGFDHILVLLNNRATYSGILSSIDSLSLDTIVIAISSHGQQVLTSSSAATEPDKVEEAIVAYDAFMRPSTNYSGKCHLLDDTLSSHVSRLAAKINPNGLIIVLLDACHSDGMNRSCSKDTITYRGTSEIFGACADSIPTLRKTYNNIDTAFVIEKKGADIIYISACKSNERSREIKDEKGICYGSLIYAFSKSWSRYSFVNIDSLIASTRSIVQSNTLQTPIVRSTIKAVASTPMTDSPKIISENKKQSFNVLYFFKIAFICLFGISFIFCCYILYVKRNGKK